MMTAGPVARNILGQGHHDRWKVNTDAEYHEEGADNATGRDVPRRLASA